ncbi:tetratricopeptide repeat protein [Paraburkholderia sp. J76]|uniref:tetratricopeptide repeat protein n=1 Tax=Paraburkholderia sp. J76 TaxID=2805439 RepID=UPI002ABD1740|nr:tetratricopeptide repeat protein [Paraburkholderia sp. J76]
MYDSALAAWRAGRLVEAERHCQTALSHASRQPETLHLAGLIAFQQGHFAKASTFLREGLGPQQNPSRLVDLALALHTQGRIDDERAALLRALELDPAIAVAHFYLANNCGAGNALEAEKHLRRALELQPVFPEAHNNLGNLLRGSRIEEARSAFERAIDLAPGFMQAHFNLGTLLAQSQPEVAEAALRRALHLDPDFAPAWNALGNLLSASRPLEAEDALRRAVALNPALAISWFNLGNLLCESRPDESVAAYRRVVALNPRAAAAWSNLAHLLSRTHPVEAETAARNAIAADPTLADAHYNLGTVLGRAKPDEAVAALERAVALQPRDANGWYQLGHVLADGDLPGAEAALRRALEVEPEFAGAQTALGDVLFKMGRLDEAIDAYRHSLACNPADSVAHSDLIFALAFQTDDPHLLLEESERYAARHEEPVFRSARAQRHANDLAPERRLRIGYVSPDFYYHCQSLFTVPLLSQHDHEAFEIFCYSGVARPDAMTARIKNFADVWRDVRTVGDTELAQQIRADRIDILIDLTMHMAGSRRPLFAHRPAPVQVAWLAYPGTTGSRAMDYRLTDPWLDPPDESGRDALYTERSLRLPDAFWCYDAQADLGAVNGLPAASGATFTFGCLNNPAKISDHALHLWSRVMAAVGDSRLLLLAPPGAPRERIAARCAAQGIDASRVAFVGHQARAPYLETYRRIDLALDSFPYNGHTTSLDAFWMGVPVVTRAGRSAASRGGWSLAANLGLPELVAHTDEDFVRVASELARDLPRLAALRAGLRVRMEASPLMDAPRFARNMERAYQKMWQEYRVAQRGLEVERAR